MNKPTLRPSKQSIKAKRFCNIMSKRTHIITRKSIGDWKRFLNADKSHPQQTLKTSSKTQKRIQRALSQNQKTTHPAWGGWLDIHTWHQAQFMISACASECHGFHGLPLPTHSLWLKAMFVDTTKSPWTDIFPFYVVFFAMPTGRQPCQVCGVPLGTRTLWGHCCHLLLTFSLFLEM